VTRNLSVVCLKKHGTARRITIETHNAIPEKKFLPANAQGIEAISFFAAGKKDTSGKPGFRREAPEMRPNSGLKCETAACSLMYLTPPL
jgi:hypothetical protein